MLLTLWHAYNSCSIGPAPGDADKTPCGNTLSRTSSHITPLHSCINCVCRGVALLFYLNSIPISTVPPHYSSPPLAFRSLHSTFEWMLSLPPVRRRTVRWDILTIRWKSSTRSTTSFSSTTIKPCCAPVLRNLKFAPSIYYRLPAKSPVPTISCWVTHSIRVTMGITMGAQHNFSVLQEDMARRLTGPLRQSKDRRAVKTGHSRMHPRVFPA